MLVGKAHDDDSTASDKNRFPKYCFYYLYIHCYIIYPPFPIVLLIVEHHLIHPQTLEVCLSQNTPPHKQVDRPGDRYNDPL